MRSVDWSHISGPGCLEAFMEEAAPGVALRTPLARVGIGMRGALEQV